MNEKQSIFERIKLYIIKPSVFFEKYKENPKYLFHLMVLTIIAIASSLISFYVNRQALDDTLNESLSGVTGQEADIISSFFGMINSPVTAFFGALILTIIGYFLGSLIYYVIVGKIFKGEGKFNHMMIIVLLASYPTSLIALVKSFLPTSLDVDLIRTITTKVNIFSLWQLFLLIIGTTVLFNMSKKKAAIIYIVLFIIGLLFALWSFSMSNAAAALQ